MAQQQEENNKKQMALEAHFKEIQNKYKVMIKSEEGSVTFEVIPRTPKSPSWVQGGQKQEGYISLEDQQGISKDNFPQDAQLLKCTRIFIDKDGKESKAEAIYDPKVGAVQTDLNNDAGVKAGLEMVQALGGKGAILPKGLSDERVEEIRKLCEEKGLKCRVGDGPDLEPPAESRPTTCQHIG